jgi:hypothetical protein
MKLTTHTTLVTATTIPPEGEVLVSRPSDLPTFVQADDWFRRTFNPRSQKHFKVSWKTDPDPHNDKDDGISVKVSWPGYSLRRHWRPGESSQEKSEFQFWLRNRTQTTGEPIS